jgi:hypothetical protein
MQAEPCFQRYQVCVFHRVPGDDSFFLQDREKSIHRAVSSSHEGSLLYIFFNISSSYQALVRAGRIQCSLTGMRFDMHGLFCLKSAMH